MTLTYKGQGETARPGLASTPYVPGTAMSHCQTAARRGLAVVSSALFLWHTPRMLYAVVSAAKRPRRTP